MTTIRLEGVDKLIEKLDSLASMKRVKGEIKNAAEYLQGYLKEQPPVPNRPNPLIKLDARVRRGFFYHLKHGDIEVPYRRGRSPGSQKLKHSWNVTTENSGWRAVVGTNVSYARLVQDSERQSSYHRHTGWITTRQVSMLHGKQAIDQIRRALHQEIENG